MPNDETGETRMKGRPRFLWDRGFSTVLRMAGPDLANRFLGELLNSFCKDTGDGPVSVRSSRIQETMAPEDPKEKFFRLDVVAESEKCLYDIEIQLRREPGLYDRAVNYAARLRLDALKAGEEHWKARRARVVCICGYRTRFPIKEGRFIYTLGHRRMDSEPVTAADVKSKVAYVFVDLALAEDLWRSLGGRKAPMDLFRAHMISSGIENGEMRRGANRSRSKVLGGMQDLFDVISGDRDTLIQWKLAQRAAEDRDSIRAAYKEQGEVRGQKKGEARGIKKGRAEGLKEGETIGIKKGEARGIKKGRAEGKLEGIEIGRAEGVASTFGVVVPGMAKAGYSVEAIAGMLNLSVEEVSKYL